MSFSTQQSFINLWNCAFEHEEERDTWLEYWVQILTEIGLENMTTVMNGMKQHLSMIYNDDQVACMIWYIENTFYYIHYLQEKEWREAYVFAMNDVMDFDGDEVKNIITTLGKIVDEKYGLLKRMYKPDQLKSIIDSFCDDVYHKYSF